jgi:Tfp pilus assembly protein PilO
MAIDLNVDVGEIFKNLFSKKSSNKAVKGESNPYLKIIIVGLVVVLSIALYIFFFYIPNQQEIRIKEEKISQIEMMRTDIDMLSVNIIKAKKDLSDATKRYDSLTKLFHTDKELEDLYGHISQLALMNQLLVSNLEKVGEIPVFEIENEDNMALETENEYSMDEYVQNDTSEQNIKKVAYYEFNVKFEISGNYANYTKFRKGMAELKKIININQENIVVLESETSKGEVKVSAILATYRLPANEDEKYITNNQEVQ